LYGQVASTSGAQTQATVVASKRLSDWLLEQPIDAHAYPLGLSWRVPGEVAAQSELRLDLLRSLSGLDREVKADPEVLARLRDWVRTLPVTGRVPVAVPDARWLQANPTRDPILQPGHSVVLPTRPRSVTVVTARGTRCAVTHSPGHEALAYIRTCSPSSWQREDWAWVAQPDGRVQRFGVAVWNAEVQDEPAPGAWIWAPPRDGGWPEPLSYKLIAFLATQGPAPDPDGSHTVDSADTPSKMGASAVEIVRGGASEAWTAFDKPLFGGASQGRQNRKDIADGDRSDIEIEKTTVLTMPSQTLPARSRSLVVTASDWGGVGLLQTPTARMQNTGHFSFNLSRAYPYTQGNIMVQPFDWLEAGFRYTNVSNVLYGPAALSGSQAYKDKSFDAKFRLWSESAYVPQVALGLRDLAGTGLFSGEYVVASKRTGPLDWNLGLGWGYVGGRGNLRNPLSLISSKFDTRANNTGQGGNFALTSYFRGPTALFGGVQYQTPWEPLTLKLEYDGNDYQHEPQSNNLRQSSPWNFGVVYRAGRSLDVTLGVERGNTAMLGITLHTQLDGITVPKLNDPPRVAVAPMRAQKSPDWSATSRDIALQTEWHVRRIEQFGRELRLTIDDANAGYWRERTERVAAVLHRDAPPSVDRFVLAYSERGVEVAEHVIDRDAWVAQQTQPLPLHEQREAIVARAPRQTAPKPEPQAALFQSTRPRFESSLGPDYRQTLGGPDAFVLYQMSALEQVKLRLSDDTWLQGSVRMRLIDNYDKFHFNPTSDAPRVRTHLREYLDSATFTLPNLQLTHVGRLSQNQYYSVYGGYLEDMFAGVGSEWLYRPFASRVAFGVDVNAVQQRNFKQDFGFRNADEQTGYRVATGHATLYWDTGWNNVMANLSAGRYLAKDIGVTVQLSRVFQNGVTIGGFFTKTNMSAATFGEGSFDKGVYVSVPFDAFLTRSSSTSASFLWKPLTRDGGAKLARASLYDLTNLRDDRTLSYGAAPPPNHASIPSDRRDAWSPPPKGPEPYTRVTPKPVAEQWAADAPGYEQRLVEALYRQQFRNIRIAYDGSRRLTLALSNDSIHPISRAVGRAARTALGLGPLDMREIHITFAERADPVVTYDFLDLVRLDHYFKGRINAAQLADSVAIDYLNPSAREKDPLARLDDVDTKAEEKRVADLLLPDSRPVGRVMSDLSGAARTAVDTNWLRMGVFGTGLVLASSALDRRGDQFAQDHAENRWLKGMNKIGNNALPWLAIGGAAAAALDGSDPVRSRTGYAAIEAGGTAFLAVEGLKSVFGRARPANDLGNHAFKPFSTTAGYDSMPSGHTIILWAVATPFAEEYDAPWLYGVAAVTNLARVGSRQHWVSDTVAGSVLGYAIGKVFWESSRAPKKGEPRVLIHPSGINMAWELN
jgi:hypothetical protein